MNLEEENREGYTVTKEMKKVWNVQIDLLKKLLDVCNKYNLKIFADGGTLLGTVRHKGYIPWDDDIDMVMLRDDYDKLVSIASKEFNSPYFFQCGHTDIFSCGFAKLRKDGTSAIIPTDISQKFHQGIFIDIFPYDAVPDDKNEFIKQQKKVETKLWKLKNACNHYFSFTNIIYDIKVLRAIFYVKLKGFHACFMEYENLFREYRIDDNKIISCISFHYNIKRFGRDKHWYDKTIYLPFEDIIIPVPIGYKQILKQQYGDDYMIPIRCATMHGGFVVLDPERSYKEYIPELKKNIRYNNWKVRKQLFFKILKK